MTRPSFVREEIMRATRIFWPFGAAPFVGYRYVNFDREINAVISLAQECASKKSTQSVLAFGYPGNGKRAFAQRIASALFDQQFHIVWVDMLALTACKGEALKHDVRDIRSRLVDDQARPLLLVINQLDAMKQGAKNNPPLEDFGGVLRGCFGHRYPPPICVLATAKFPPDAMEFLPQETSLFYFSWPREQKEVAELLRLAGIPASDDVATKLFRLASDREVLYTTSSIVNGAFAARRIAAEIGRLESMTSQECAEIILDLCLPTSVEEARSYREKYKQYIQMAANEPDARAPSSADFPRD